MTKGLIFNADDFGLSRGVNLGVIRAYEEGIVTASSLMVRGKSVHEAAAYAIPHKDLSLGLHFDFGEWFFENGAWRPAYELVQPAEACSVEQEALSQLDAFRALIGRGPTHIDSHQHFHRREPFKSVLVNLSRQLRIPLRELSDEIRFCGSFYGQTKEGDPLSENISVGGLIQILETLPDGVTELSCHPAAIADTQSPYDIERTAELETLCDPSIRVALSRCGIQLCSF